MTPHRLTEAELRGLAPHGVARSYPRGTIVVAEGDSGDSLYVIVEGRVKIYASDEDGAEVVFVTQGPREYFGEMVLDGGVRSASVVTLEKSRFLVVPMASLRQVIAENPGFALSIMKKLIGRVREMTTGMKNLALMDVYGRVVRLLAELAERRDEGLVIEGRHTHQDLASRVGASREMVGRVLKDLTGGGYITLQR
ncbi:MAG: Crp/Fnr family transcriptional regulator, partial [Burkholderiales bacterium]|nr:Crp/Fnr family transcriptional regulator [Burkholderiales bacterium]